MSHAIQQQEAVTIEKNEAFAVITEELTPQLHRRVCYPKHAG